MWDDLTDRSFVFFVRLMELIKYLQEEHKEFPLSMQLLTCGNGIGVNLHVAERSGGIEQPAAINQALACAVEVEHLLMLMAKTGYLTERQSMPLREECDYLTDLIAQKRRSK